MTKKIAGAERRRHGAGKRLRNQTMQQTKQTNKQTNKQRKNKGGVQGRMRRRRTQHSRTGRAHGAGTAGRAGAAMARHAPVTHGGRRLGSAAARVGASPRARNFKFPAQNQTATSRSSSLVSWFQASRMTRKERRCLDQRQLLEWSWQRRRRTASCGRRGGSLRGWTPKMASTSGKAASSSPSWLTRRLVRLNNRNLTKSKKKKRERKKERERRKEKRRSAPICTVHVCLLHSFLMFSFSSLALALAFIAGRPCVSWGCWMRPAGCGRRSWRCCSAPSTTSTPCARALSSSVAT